jgi:hypothetical protein
VGTFLSLLLVIMVGCQVAQGVDFNQTLQKNAQIQSYEANQSVHLQVLTDSTFKPEGEGAAILALFKDTSLKFTGEKVKDNNHLSTGGELTYTKGSIPFKLYVDGDKMAFTVEGAKKPMVIDSSNAGIGTSPINPVQLDSAQIMQENAQKITSFIVKQLPNPRTLQVSQETAVINGETLAVQKVHAQIKGSEVGDLLNDFLHNLVADEQGFKDFFKVISVIGVPEGSKPSEDELNKAADDAYQQLKTELPTLLDQINSGLSSEEAKRVLNENTTLTADLYLDSSGLIRKSMLELNAALPAKDTGGISGIKLTLETEKWNLGQPITPETANTDGALLLNEKTRPVHVLKNLDPESQLYGLLVNDAGITRVNRKMHVMNEAIPYFKGIPYLKNNVTMVPTVMISEELGADVTWDGVNKQIIVKDVLKGTVIVLKEGSTTAYVDGTPVELPVAPETLDGRNYVPARFIVKALGGDIKWNGAHHSVEITKN